MLQRRKSESHASAYLTPPEYADLVDDADSGSRGPDPSELVAEIHRLIRETPAESSEYIHSYRTAEKKMNEREKTTEAEPKTEDSQVDDTAERRTTDSALTINALESSGASTPSQLEASSARTSMDFARRRSRIQSKGEPRRVRKVVGTELRKLFSKR